MVKVEAGQVGTEGQGEVGCSRADLRGLGVQVDCNNESIQTKNL